MWELDLPDGGEKDCWDGDLSSGRHMQSPYLTLGKKHNSDTVILQLVFCSLNIHEMLYLEKYLKGKYFISLKRQRLNVWTNADQEIFLLKCCLLRKDIESSRGGILSLRTLTLGHYAPNLFFWTALKQLEKENNRIKYKRRRDESPTANKHSARFLDLGKNPHILKKNRDLDERDSEVVNVILGIGSLVVT